MNLIGKHLPIENVGSHLTLCLLTDNKILLASVCILALSVFPVVYIVSSWYPSGMEKGSDADSLFID
jgi:hypothetical protein